MNVQTEYNIQAKPTVAWSSTILPSKHILILLIDGLRFYDFELHLIKAIYLDQELKRFTDLRMCMPSTFEESLRFIFGGELVDTETMSCECPNVYKGKTKPGTTSQLLKMSLTFFNDQIEPNQVRLEFIEEQNKSLVLKNEMIEWHNSSVEIGFEHYLIGLAWGADYVIVENWNVCKRIET